MHRTVILIGAAALGAAALGLPVHELAASLAFVLGLVMVTAHLVGSNQLAQRLAPAFAVLVGAALMWGGVATAVRLLVGGVLASPVVWLVVVFGAAICIISALLLAVAHVLPDAEKPTLERRTTRSRTRVIDPASDSPEEPAARPRPARDDDFDFFGSDRG